MLIHFGELGREKLNTSAYSASDEFEKGRKQEIKGFCIYS